MNSDCIFCKIIRGESPADFVFQNEFLVGFKDIRPASPVHILLVPRKHIRSVNDLEEPDRAILSELIFCSREVARQQGIDKSGYRIHINTERGGGQYVFHLHLHLLGGWKQ
jgi:histidine triad (HIT) family protein